VVLVEPFAEERAGKLVQMRAAADLFYVPPWKLVRGSASFLDRGRTALVKSLTQKRVAPKSVIYATRVAEGDLDPAAPWLVQEYVAAAADVTVVFVRGELFAFELDRARFVERAADWRVVSLEPGGEAWRPHVLPPDTAAAVRTLMGRLALDYGRIDLLCRAPGGGRGEYAFLEVNPHGEWGWLDPRGEHGVLGAIVREVAPDTPVHPIPG
jgi:hypothetical protein